MSMLQWQQCVSQNAVLFGGASYIILLVQMSVAFIHRSRHNPASYHVATLQHSGHDQLHTQGICAEEDMVIYLMPRPKHTNACRVVWFMPKYPLPLSSVKLTELAKGHMQHTHFFKQSAYLESRKVVQNVNFIART